MAIARSVAISFLVTGVVSLGACGSEQSSASEESASAGKEFDWERGRFERVRLGDSTARLVRVTGRSEKRGPNQPLEPIGEDFYDIGGLTNFRTPNTGTAGDYEALRYRRLVVSVIGGKVFVFGTTDERARTPEGVGVGDSQDLVKRRYPRARCFIQNEGTEYTTTRSVRRECARAGCLVSEAIQSRASGWPRKREPASNPAVGCDGALSLAASDGHREQPRVPAET